MYKTLASCFNHAVPVNCHKMALTVIFITLGLHLFELQFSVNTESLNNESYTNLWTIV